MLEQRPPQPDNIAVEPTNHPASEEPFYFSGGYKYDHERNGRVADYIQHLGHVTLSPMPNPDRGCAPNGCIVKYPNGGTEDVTNWEAYRVKSGAFGAAAIISKWQQRRAEQLIEHVEQQSPDKPVNAIFQSADAINGVLAAGLRPDKFKNLVLAFPAGMAERRGQTEYQRDMMRSARTHKGTPWRPYEFEPQETKLQSLRKRRHSNSGGAAVAMSTAVSYQPKLLNELKQRENAPGVAMVLGLRDSTILPERVIQSLADPDNDIDCLLITNTGHGVRGDKKTMDEMLGLFPKIEEVNAKRRSGESVPPLEERVVFSDNVGVVDRERILALIGDRRREVRARTAFCGVLSVRIPGIAKGIGVTT